jgi:hypothetical protein
MNKLHHNNVHACVPKVGYLRFCCIPRTAACMLCVVLAMHIVTGLAHCETFLGMAGFLRICSWQSFAIRAIAGIICCLSSRSAPFSAHQTSTPWLLCASAGPCCCLRCLRCARDDLHPPFIAPCTFCVCIGYYVCTFGLAACQAVRELPHAAAPSKRGKLLLQAVAMILRLCQRFLC